jgi:hypothetical protein
MDGGMGKNVQQSPFKPGQLAGGSAFMTKHAPLLRCETTFLFHCRHVDAQAAYYAPRAQALRSQPARNLYSSRLISGGACARSYDLFVEHRYKGTFV